MQGRAAVGGSSQRRGVTLIPGWEEFPWLLRKESLDGKKVVGVTSWGLHQV